MWGGLGVAFEDGVIVVGWQQKDVNTSQAKCFEPQYIGITFKREIYFGSDVLPTQVGHMCYFGAVIGPFHTERGHRMYLAAQENN